MAAQVSSPHLLNVPNADDNGKYRVKPGALDDIPAAGAAAGAGAGKAQVPGAPVPASAPAAAGASAPVNPVAGEVKISLEPQSDLLASLEEKTGIPKVWIALGGVALAWVIIVSIFGAHTFVHFVAFAYPAFMSYKVLEYSGRGPADDVTQLVHWLTYWVVYALFIGFEMVCDPLLAWMTWYTVGKIAFLFWCFLPQTMGCGIVYNVCVRPFLFANEKRIDTLIDRLHFAAMQAGAEIRDVSSEVAATAISNIGSSLFVSALNNQNKAKAKAAKDADADDDNESPAPSPMNSPPNPKKKDS